MKRQARKMLTGLRPTKDDIGPAQNAPTTAPAVKSTVTFDVNAVLYAASVVRPKYSR